MYAYDVVRLSFYITQSECIVHVNGIPTRGSTGSWGPNSLSIAIKLLNSDSPQRMSQSLLFVLLEAISHCFSKG